jgi:formylglycine-generating enzyme required for sulfatase activity
VNELSHVESRGGKWMGCAARGAACAWVGLVLGVIAGPERTVASPNSPPAGMVRVPVGAYRPPFRNENDPREVAVAAFYIDVFPVTNGEFLEFVRANPRWQRSQVKRLFADGNYLKHWAGDLDLGAHTLTNQPVTWVSWFAAKACAAWKGRRLPTTAEWEYVAAASPRRPDGENDPAFQSAIRRWLSTPLLGELPRVGRGVPNFWGVHDQHGLVWEWLSDFNAALVTGDARGDTGIERQLFCGGGATGAKDPANYPAFMRYGFRSSLKAGYTVHNLGFRCAKDL